MNMKKLLFTGALCLIVSLSFGQKKVVSSAKNEIKGSTPNIGEARTLIKGALANPETANDAETWYVAGQIENKQFDAERTKEILSRQVNEAVMYEALGGIIPYFTKALDLDKRPDEKGKVKLKFTKDIKSIIKVNRPFYVNAGIYYYEKEDYKKAYDNFKLYFDIPKLDIFDESDWVIIPNDTNDLKIEYYAGYMATLIPDHEAAIEIFSRIKDKDLANSSEIYQRLCNEYDQIKDSVSFSKLIREGFVKFPGEEYYVLNLINLSITSGNTDEAVGYLKTAIEQSPKNEQLYDVLGQVYEAGKDNENAILTLQKALELNPDYIDALTHLGRIYFNLGVETRSAADDITNVAKSKEESQKALEYFKKALPHFEKAFGIDAKNKDSIYALRSIYYNLGMEPEYLKMDAMYSDGSNDD
jgi:tetratricopeptide (TPR) repeat protein